MQSREERLEGEVRELRAELRRLTLRVDQQGDQLVDLSDSVHSRISAIGSEGAELSFSPGTGGRADPVEESLASYSVVGTNFSREPERETVPRPSSAPLLQVHNWRLREEVAIEIGGFLRRALLGERRGPSGRERLKELASHYYIVVRNHSGETFESPVRVYTRFHLTKAVCYRSGSWGKSIFIGVPTSSHWNLVNLKSLQRRC